jgi:hypothetical protein
MRAILVAFLALWCCAAAAQLRAIPEEAKRGVMRHLEVMVVELDGQPQPLAPGAQIRDAENRVVLPSALPPNSLVKYQRDVAGQVNRVWILSPQEAQQEDKQ